MKSRLIKFFNKTLSIGSAFAISFLLVRFFFWWSISGRVEGVNQLGLQIPGFFEDLSVAAIFVLAIGLTGAIVALISTLFAVTVEIMLFGIVLAASFGAAEYFSITLIPLGAELFGYAMDDVTITVHSSVGGETGIVAKLILLYLVFGALIYFLLRKDYFGSIPANRRLVVVAGIILFVFLPLRAKPEDFENDLAYHIKMNKLWYTLVRAVDYLNDDAKLMVIEEGSYPLLKAVDYSDSLGLYFNRAETYPNLVFIVVEGLGRDFSGPRSKYGGFTPFLDSLSMQSLYWQNAVSNAGRTFGAPPTILGSLPYGSLGLMEYGNAMPDHQTLITLLKPYGYESNFFYGGNPNFDNLDLFLERNGIDFFLNESNFQPGNIKDSWGYNDRLVFNAGLAKIQGDKNSRLDVYLTTTTHEPFICPDSSIAVKADRMIERVQDNIEKQVMLANKGIFECLLFTDEALRWFISEYSKRRDFANTIFIITGDHRLVPIPVDNNLKRFHVPLLMYSSLVKKPETFSGIAAHSSILLSVLSLLKDQYGMSFPKELPFISQALPLQKEFSSNLDVPLIRNKNIVEDFVSGKHFLSGDRVHTILPDMQLKVEDNPELKRGLKKELQEFQQKSNYAISHNRLDRISDRRESLFVLTASEQQYLKEENILSLDPDRKLEKAQVLARANDYKKCQAIIKSILNQSPNYHDARILMGRSYAWQKKYDSAKIFLNETLKRSPHYADAHAALADIDFWQKRLNECLNHVNGGLGSNPTDPELLSRKARVLFALNRRSEARTIIADLKRSHFTNEIVVELESKLR